MRWIFDTRATIGALFRGIGIGIVFAVLVVGDAHHDWPMLMLVGPFFVVIGHALDSTEESWARRTTSKSLPGDGPDARP
jgi:hypothetical protein